MAGNKKEIKEVFIRIRGKTLEISKDNYDIKFIHDIYKFLNDKKLLGKCRKEVMYELFKFLNSLIKYWQSKKLKDIPTKIELDDSTYSTIYSFREVR